MNRLTLSSVIVLLGACTSLSGTPARNQSAAFDDQHEVRKTQRICERYLRQVRINARGAVSRGSIARSINNIDCR